MMIVNDFKVQPVIKNNFAKKRELPCKYADRSKPCGAILKDAVNNSLSLHPSSPASLSSIYPKLEMADLKGCERASVECGLWRSTEGGMQKCTKHFEIRGRMVLKVR